MRIIQLALGLMFFGTVALSEPPLTCDGHDPDWSLTIAGPVAQMRSDRKTDFTIPQSSVAEGKTEWPRAYTLISDFDTAIVLVNEARCTTDYGEWPITAHILTQRGQTPILLTGCCTVAE